MLLVAAGDNKNYRMQKPLKSAGTTGVPAALEKKSNQNGFDFDTSKQPLLVDLAQEHVI